MILFASLRPLSRAENIRAVYEAYKWEKDFVMLNDRRTAPALTAANYDVLVTDEFPSEARGKVIMICHGISGGKLYGLDRPGFMTRSESELITYIVCAGTGTIPIVAKQAGVDPSKVLPLGMPRTDAYFGAKKGDGRSELAGKRAYLYVPTFRGRRDPPLTKIDWDYIDDHLTNDEVFAIKPHMITGEARMFGYKRIRVIPSFMPSEDYLIDSDVVITDYSSILFDAHVLKKPVILFEKDEGAYLMTRGMYYDYPEGYASRHCTTEEELIRMLREATAPGDLDEQCRQRCTDACDGHSTERVIDLIERCRWT